MKPSIIKNKVFLTFVGILLFFGLWFLIAQIVGEKTLVFPSPIETFAYLGQCLGNSYIYRCLGYSLLKTLIGFVIALALAFLFGLLAGHFNGLKQILDPSLSVVKAIPSAAIIFLFLVLFGVQQTPSIMVVVIAFPILYEALARGVMAIDPFILMSTRIDGTASWRRLWRITLPEVFPYLMVGVSSSFSLSFKIEIMAEIISGDTGSGIGSAILYAQRNNPADMTPIFAYSFIAIFIVLLATFLLKLVEDAYKKKIL